MSFPFIPTAFEKTAKWMRRGGRESDIALSSRVRLARNLKRFEFPHHASPQELLTVRHKTFLALEHNKGTSGLTDVKLLPFEEFAGWERQSLIDRHLTSREHVSEELARGLAATPDASLSVLVNEEDHLRLQSLLPGLQLVAAFELVDHVDDALESYFDAHGGVAYSDEFGYLTACPTNAGTGMRASVMLHLPALEISGKVERARKWAEGKGLTSARHVWRRLQSVGPFASIIESGDAWFGRSRNFDGRRKRRAGNLHHGTSGACFAANAPFD